MKKLLLVIVIFLAGCAATPYGHVPVDWPFHSRTYYSAYPVYVAPRPVYVAPYKPKPVYTSPHYKNVATVHNQKLHKGGH